MRYDSVLFTLKAPHRNAVSPSRSQQGIRSKGMLRGLVALSLLIPCSQQVIAQRADNVIATVGNIRITAHDLVYKIGVERAYGNTVFNREAALAALITEAIESEVARKVGQTASASDLQALNTHVDTTTKAPEILAHIKQVFGADRASYERLFLSPRIINSRLHTYFAHNLQLHTEERGHIEQALQLARAGKPLSVAAKECGLRYVPFGNTPSSETTPGAPAPSILMQPMSTEDTLSRVVRSLRVGEVGSAIVENDVCYSVIRLLERRDQTFRGESIVAMKSPFDPWFQAKAHQVCVQITDLQLAHAITKKYPDIWWVRQR